MAILLTITVLFYSGGQVKNKKFKITNTFPSEYQPACIRWARKVLTGNPFFGTRAKPVPATDGLVILIF